MRQAYDLHGWHVHRHIPAVDQDGDRVGAHARHREEQTGLGTIEPEGGDQRSEGYGEEISVDESEADLGFYQGEGIELDDVLREYILLALPMQKLCKEDCKGICPVCGQNRNQVDCQCKTTPMDPRWESLKSLQ